MRAFEFEVSPFAFRDARDRGEHCEFKALQLEAPPGMPTLRLGSRGTAVAELQRRLASLGLATGTADGVFGSRTDAAVRSFQRARGLAADGIVGAQTWGLLLGTTTPRPPSPTPTPPPTGLPGQPLVTVPSGVRISDNAVRVLKDILRAAGLTRATVTSGRRTPHDQARIMYELIERHGVAYAKELYGRSGDQVIDAYAAAKAAGKSATDIKGAMEIKVNQLGCHNVSHHCSDSFDVFDVAPSTISDSAAFRRALDAAVASGAIKMYLSPPEDPAFHIEIALTPGAGELEAEFKNGRRGPTVLPTLTIRVRPFVVLDRFAHKSSVMPAAHAPIIERVARLVVASRLSRQPLNTIRLVGHADSTGAQPFNFKLGEKRAQSVETKLRAAIAALGPVPAGSLNIVVQTLGESKRAAPNTTAAGRALNRRVEVFLDATCHSFFAQYDLRFLPGDRVFGIPAHPNLALKAQREADVNTMAGELTRRRDQRAAAALAGRVPAPRPLAVGTTLRSIALRLSSAQLALLREYFDDGRGGIDFIAFQSCFARFANGELRSPLAADRAKGVGEPNSDFFFLFAEFAFVCVASRIEPLLWTQALRAFVGTQEIFMHVYRRAPVSLAPAVGAPLPSCPLDAQGRRTVRHALSNFSNRNFGARGASALVGVGQSSPARKRALAAKYASATTATLQREAQANLQRAQCMT